MTLSKIKSHFLEVVLDLGFEVGYIGFQFWQGAFVAVGKFGHSGRNLVAGSVVQALDSFKDGKAPLVLYK